jgi:regulator of RNase E activity RraA
VTLHDLNDLTCAHLADACIRLGADVRCGPAGLRAVTPGSTFAGPAQPVVHTGSVDIILEALSVMAPGGVLVIDDGARTDRACIGDLMALEAHLAGASAMVINGLHRDTAELLEIPMPVFSLGSCPTGPLSWETSPPSALQQCRLGEWTITADDVIVGDADGVIVLPSARLDELIEAARGIRDRERRQAAKARAGTPLREQFDFAGFLTKRTNDPTYSFRQHLTHRAASIEE